MDVSLAPELEREVEERVRTGQFASATELVSEALHLLFSHDPAQSWVIDDLEEKVREGLAELDRGLGILGPDAQRQARELMAARSAERRRSGAADRGE